VRDWSSAGLKILKQQAGGLTEIPTTFVVAQRGAETIAAVDDLVEMVAAYGFEFRTEAEAAVAQAHSTVLALAIGTSLVGLLIAAGFAYSLSGPVFAAMHPPAIYSNPAAMRTRCERVEHPFGTIKARMDATHLLMKRLGNVAA
jgi:hypothetical protein